MPNLGRRKGRRTTARWFQQWHQQLRLPMQRCAAIKQQPAQTGWGACHRAWNSSSRPAAANRIEAQPPHQLLASRNLSLNSMSGSCTKSCRQLTTDSSLCHSKGEQQRSRQERSKREDVLRREQQLRWHMQCALPSAHPAVQQTTVASHDPQRVDGRHRARQMLCRVQQRGDGYGGGAAAAAAAAGAQGLLAVIGAQDSLSKPLPHLAQARLGRVKPARGRWETPRRFRCAGSIGAIRQTSGRSR